MIYFIQEDESDVVGGGLIKVGYSQSGRQAEQRRASLQVGNGRPLYIRAELAHCGLAVERAYHKALKSSKIGGEWFLPTKRVLRAMRWATAHPRCEPIDVELFLDAEKVALRKRPKTNSKKRKEIEELADSGSLIKKVLEAKIAKFQTVCPDCLDYISPGEEIAPTRIEGKYVHAGCTNLLK